MKFKKDSFLGLFFLIFLLGTQTLFGQEDNYPHPETNPESSLMFAGEWIPENIIELNFANLPRIPSEHSIVSDVRYAWGTKVHQHNYLIYYNGIFFVMWSNGPGIPRKGLTAKEHREVWPGHDNPGQLISYSTSVDGMTWTEPRDLAGPPETGLGWIARGFWIRDDKLLALGNLYDAPLTFTGGPLQLHAFEFVTGQEREWRHIGLVFDNAMNNFPPKKLPDGNWMMTRRDEFRNTYALIGGIKSIDDWKSYDRIIDSSSKDFAGGEPYWLILPDGNLVMLIRDNQKRGYLYRAFSTDNGRTWSRPVSTNFPDAGSKFFGLRLSDGRYVLINNSNPKKRDPLTIAISDDGLVYNKMAYLVGGRHVDYPHAIEVDGYIYVAFSGAKQTVEILKIKISELDKINISKGPKN
jgi:hypothetical protein